jgi:RNA polymerase sigma factor (sigma-70 family)
MEHSDINDIELLRRYCGDHSEEAFSELVRRHIDWVYSVCRRQMRDADLAEDVTQVVFMTLARRASDLSESVSISGWLFTTARYACLSALKIERRRRMREQKAAAMRHEVVTPDVEPQWQKIEPILDAALSRLNSHEREAIILRYFRGMPHEAVANILGISEEAAKKRVARGLAHLRKTLGSPAAVLTDSAVATLMLDRATLAAPAQLASKSVAALNAGPAGRPELILKGMSLMRTLTTVKIALGVAAILAASVTTVALVDERPADQPTVLPKSDAGSNSDVESIAPFDISDVQNFCVAGIANGLTFTKYYRRQTGVVQHYFAPGWSVTHYILGNTEYVLRDGGSLVIKKIPDLDTTGQLNKLESNLSSIQNAKAVRDPGSDSEIEGIQCVVYRLQGGPEPFTNARVYIDPATGRPARIRTDGDLIDVTITYDPHLPDSVFTLPTIAGVGPITPQEFLEKKYPLEGALYIKEGVGQIFAVHEVTQDSSGCFQIVCSSRLTPGVRAALANVPDDTELGKFQFAERAHYPFHYLNLAEIRESGFQVDYLIAIPNTIPSPGDVCRLPVEMGAPDRTLDAAKISYGPHTGHDVHLSVELTVPQKPNPPTTMDFESRVYDDVAPLVGLFSWTEISGPGFGINLGTKQDTLIEVQEKLSRYLSDRQSP